MNGNNCGCSGSSASKQREYFMVETTPSEASLCTPVEEGSNNAGCAKQEPTFDVIQNGFIVPLNQNSVEVRVCNPNVYSPGQWIETLGNPRVTMLIASINGNNLSLVNGCSNGAIVEDNPDAGLAIPSGTRFSVVSEPPCETSEQSSEALDAALNAATQLCVPNLTESSDNAIIQMVGRIESNPDDTGFKRCIKKVKGFFFKAGTPVIETIQPIDVTSNLTYRKLAIHKSNKEVREIPNHSEDSRLAADKQYVTSILKTKETPVGPVWFPSFFYKELIQLPADRNLTHVSWPRLSSAGAYSQSINLNIAEITSLLKEQDHYYVMCRITCGLGFPVVVESTLSAYLNEVLACEALGFPDSSTYVVSKNTAVVPIKVMAADNLLAVRLQCSTAAAYGYYLRLEIDGVYI